MCYIFDICIITLKSAHEFEQNLKSMKKITEYQEQIDGLNLICIEDRFKIERLVKKATIKSRMSLKTIYEAVLIFSKGKTINLKKTLSYLIKMHDKGINASECGRRLGKYYSYGVKLGFSSAEIMGMATESKSKKQLKKDLKSLSNKYTNLYNKHMDLANENNEIKLKIKAVSDLYAEIEK